MKTVFGSEISLPFDKFIELNNAGQCNIGISKPLADAVAQGRIPMPFNARIKAAQRAFWLWTIVAYIPLIYGIYQSFATAWWSFILGILAMGIVGKIGDRANQKNILSAAEQDEAVYDSLRGLNGWAYEIDERVLEGIKAAS